MTADPLEPYEIIRPHAEPAAIIPLHELRVLKALKDRAPADLLEEAEMDAAIAEHEAWVAAGSPGGYMSHEEAMAILLREQ